MLTKADFKVGMKVHFGRRNGEKTLGEIVKLNPTKAKVKTLETRGALRERDAGVIWNVPYNLMSQVTQHGDKCPSFDGYPCDCGANAKPPAKLKYNPFGGSDNLILEAILDCYSGLSPENLCMDGEASMAHINHTRSELNRKLRGLFTAFGRTVHEGEAYDWFRQKQDYERERT